MTKRLKFFLFIFFLIIVCISKIDDSKADAWTQNKGNGIIIGSIEAKQFNGIDTIGRFDKNKPIHQTVFNVYGEYGITDRFTIGGKIIAVDSMQMQDNTFLSKVKNRSFALDTTQFFTRIRIFKNDFFVLSIVAQIGLPSFYKESDISYFSIKKWNYEPRIEMGFNFGKNDFLTLTAGYHRNIKHFYDEGRFELTYGHYIESVLFMAKLQKYIYIITNKDEMNLSYSKLSLLSSIYDYLSKSGFAKLNLSMVFPVDDKLKLEIGGYMSLKTKLLFTENLDLNLKGIYISVWYEF